MGVAAAQERPHARALSSAANDTLAQLAPNKAGDLAEGERLAARVHLVGEAVLLAVPAPPRETAQG